MLTLGGIGGLICLSEAKFTESDFVQKKIFIPSAYTCVAGAVLSCISLISNKISNGHFYDV